VQLKRFRYNSYLPSKISAKVNFPINDFDISPYMSLNRKNKDDILRYDLIGIINHRGSIGGGHYVAYCKSDADSLWYEFDDSFTRPVSESYVRNVQAYVLFYRKKVLGKEEERSAIQKLSSGNLVRFHGLNLIQKLNNV
jgi:ubiquitin C-terminal hydrolase